MDGMGPGIVLILLENIAPGRVLYYFLPQGLRFIKEYCIRATSEVISLLLLFFLPMKIMYFRNVLYSEAL